MPLQRAAKWLADNRRVVYFTKNGVSISNAFVLGPPLNGPAVAGGRAGVFLSITAQDGDKLVSASAPGYNAITGRVVNVSQGTTTLTLVLQRATTNSLTVIGEVRTSAGGSVSTSSAPPTAPPESSNGLEARRRKCTPPTCSLG